MGKRYNQYLGEVIWQKCNCKHFLRGFFDAQASLVYKMFLFELKSVA